MKRDSNNNGRVLSEEEFGRLFAKCRSFYITIANSYVHDSDTAADLVHDSFVRLWEKRNDIRTDNFEAWLFETVTNRCLDWLKSKQTRSRILQNIHDVSYRMLLYETAALENLDPEKLYAAEVETIFKECIERMPTITRKVFVDHRFENKTYKEISEEYGIAPRRVTAEIQSALRLLRVSLKDYINILILTASAISALYII